MTDRAPIRWLHHWPPDGPAAIRIGRAGDQIIAEWIGVATLRAEVHGSASELVVESGSVSPRVKEKLREQAAALVRHLRGGITLHASSVAFEGVAIAFLGDSYAGKSTLAAQLCADPRFALLSDDAAAIRHGDAGVEILPTERDHWLRPDVARAMGLDPGDEPKIPKEPLRSARGGARLRAVIALAFDDAAPVPTLRPVRGAEAFSLLSLSTFRFAFDVPDVLRQELDGLAQIVEQARFYELRRPRDLARMDASPRAVALLLEDLSREGRAP